MNTFSIFFPKKTRDTDIYIKIIDFLEKNLSLEGFHEGGKKRSFLYEDVQISVSINEKTVS